VEENIHLIESLLEKATECGKTSYELVKLQVVDKVSNRISTLIPPSIVMITLSTFIVFVNLGVAFWLGEILGKIFYGFFVVAGFYAIIAFVLYFFLRKWMKRMFYDYVIRQLLN
jgi:hypothetical protein